MTCMKEQDFSHLLPKNKGLQEVGFLKLLRPAIVHFFSALL